MRFLFSIASLSLLISSASRADDETLVLPPAVRAQPAADVRAIVQRREYAESAVRHTLYLPADWSPDWQAEKKHWPVIVEYTGNRYPAAGSTGEVEDAGLGFGLSQGRFIWLVLPYVRENRTANAVTWWGDITATVDYAKTTVPEVCLHYGGDADTVLLCGFSRGAIGVNFIGLHDDEIAKLWCGFITHDHYDGQREWRGTEWGSPLDDYRHEAAIRLERLQHRPVLVCQNKSTASIRRYLKSTTSLEPFSFLDVDTKKILGPFPNAIAIHPHNDRWLLKPSEERDAVRDWIDRVTAK